MDKSVSEAGVRDLVQRYQVCWETYKEEALVTCGVRAIGFGIDLFGTHEPGIEHVSPGCEHCKRVQSALKQIAEWILPREERPSMYEVSVEDQSLIYSPQRRNRPDVLVRIRILHRSGFEQPIDDCEVRCLKEMEQTLLALGACKRAWSPSVRKPRDSSLTAVGSGT